MKVGSSHRIELEVPMTTRLLRTLPFLAASAALGGCPAVEPPPCGEFDEVFAYTDNDGDGYGSTEAVGWVCELVAGTIDNASDCDDAAENVHPNAEEACDSTDNDCNGRVDEGNAFVPWYPDNDGDGYGVTLDAVIACESPGAKFVRTGDDCDDTLGGVNPVSIEVCNDGTDDDCDGLADDADPGVDPTTMTRWYFDGDGDGFGDDTLFMDFCLPPVGQPGVTENGDCDDERAVVNPDAQEVCNRDRDDDCDGLADDDDPSIDPATQDSYYADDDGDGFGNALQAALACEPTPGIGVANDRDCDDTNFEANIVQDWYADSDGDGAGDGAVVTVSCLDPGGGLVPEQSGLDCEPLDDTIFPLQLEDCFDGIDQNCDNALDCADQDCFTEPTCVPPCADDVLAPTSLPFATSGNTVGQGDDEQPTTCSFAAGAPDLQFWFTPPVSGNITIDMIGSAYDTTLYVLDACGGTELVCNDDFWGLQSQVTFSATAGVPVLVVVDGYSAGAGAFNLNFN
jgi:hypothetical protein